MSYAVQADLLQRVTAAELVALTDDTKTGEANVVTIQGALDEATATIDSYTRDRYVTPLQTSNVATMLCRDIAIYNLFGRRPQKMTEVIRQRYEDAIRALKDIAAGKASLDQPVGAATPQSPSSAGVKPCGHHQKFGEHNLEGFI